MSTVVNRLERFVVFFAPLLLVLCIACGSSTPKERDISDATITLQRTPCYGHCPVYNVTIFGTGVVKFVGTRYTAATGEQTATVSIPEVRSLIEFIELSGYDEFSERYVMASVTDMPSAISSLTIGGKKKMVEHYQGDFNAPKVLSEIERRIDSLANVSRWIDSL